MEAESTILAIVLLTHAGLRIIVDWWSEPWSHLAVFPHVSRFTLALVAGDTVHAHTAVLADVSLAVVLVL